MFGTIRRHQTWLWVVIITITIASFVIFGPTNSKIGDALKRGDANFGFLAGKPIKREQLVNALRETQLDGFLKTQQWPDPNAPETTRQAYMRLFLIQKQEELGITVPTEAAAAFAHRILGNAPLDEFTDKVLKPQGMDAMDFDRFLRHELGIDQLSMTAGVSGRLVTPQEAETLYKLEHRDLETYLVYFTASNFLAQATAPAAALQDFYTNQLANYRVPEQVQVEYVKFNVTNYLASASASVTNLDQAVEDNVRRLGTNLFHNAKTPEESKAAVRSEIIRQHALVDARRAALNFAETLDQGKEHTLAAFNKLASSLPNTTVHTTARFDREYGPQDIIVPPVFTKNAFAVTQDEPFAGPIPADDGVYVIAFKNRFAPETPTFDKIEAKVTADYKFGRAEQLAQQAAFDFDAKLTNGLAAGKSFTAICAQEGRKYETLPPFSLSTRGLTEEVEEKINFGLLKQVAFGTPVGKASAVAGARDGAFILYVAKELPLDEPKMKAELPGFTAYLRNVRQADAFNQWFNAQAHQDPDFLQYVQRMAEEAQSKNAKRPKS